jgi:hypothetical protein
MDAQSFILGLAFIFPAYVSNATPVVVVRFLARRHPIDFGRVFVDGRRVLGDGKTFEGLFSGTAAGFLTGALIHLYTPWLVSLTQALLPLPRSTTRRHRRRVHQEKTRYFSGRPRTDTGPAGLPSSRPHPHIPSLRNPPMARRIHTSHPNAFHSPHARRNKHSRIPTRAKRQMVLKMGPWVQHVHGTGFHRG